MEITKKQIESHRERTIISHCIMNTNFLSKIVKVMKESYFKAPYSKTVYSWVREHYDQYGTAPEHKIMDIYMAYKLSIPEGEDSIGVFLQSLSENYTPPSALDYELKVSTDWCRLRATEVLVEKLKEAVEHKDFQTAENIIANYSKVEHVESDSIDVLSEKSIQIVVDAFTMTDEKLFSFPGAFGQLTGDMKVGDFFGFLAPMKKGKSFLMLYSGLQALSAGRRVLFINLEMTKAQVLRRIYQGLTFTPQSDREVQIPYFYKDGGEGLEKIGYRTEFRKAFQPTEESIGSFLREYKQYHPNGGFRVATFPAKTTTVSDIKKYVENLAYYEDFQPEVVVLDYADLLNTKGHDYRVGLGLLWAELRGWASQTGICLITASQSNRGSINASVIDATHVAEDVSKIAAVTGMVSINATKQEMLNGIYRFNQVAVREGDIFTDQVIGLNCLSIGAVNINSRFLSEVDYKLPQDEEKGRGKKDD